MPPSIYFPKPSHAHHDKPYHFSNGGTLPSAVNEKYYKQYNPNSPWILTRTFPLPGSRRRRLRVWYPNTTRLYRSNVTRFGRKRGTVIFCLTVLIVSFLLFLGTYRGASRILRNDSTIVFRREELQRIWKWEIESGHYPSRREIPPRLLLKQIFNNPSLPPTTYSSTQYAIAHKSGVTTTNPMGPKRRYVQLESTPPDVAYPPRPISGSVADLDVVMDYCDFSHKKYVRDCLEVLRMGAGLDNGNRLRRGRMGPSKYIYLEEESNSTTPFVPTPEEPRNTHPTMTIDSSQELKRRSGVEWEGPLSLGPPATYRPYYSLPTPCDPESLRVFHMFWTGPFTDKPYMALLSFLFTQNTGLHLPRDHIDPRVCRPQIWLWINPGPASSVPNTTVTHDMFESLKSNPWSAPFLHPRFKDVISFKLWNTTEQLDGIPEIKDEWRKLTSIFNSGGHRHNVPPPMAEGEEGPGPTSTRRRNREEELKSRTGSTSAAAYDQLSVILSDIARFVLCHRYGGTYLDADTIFLRDWEELWGWKGAFAYRWSRLERYNTAVLKMNKGSALGSWLFRTVFKNDMDFHPFKLSVYAKQAMTEGLLLRLPDALFDPAWLNTEDYQLDRPAQPVFTTFLAFFDAPAPDNGAPSSTGFSGFFRGAFSYHFHNYWWEPFDPARNWPDLGPTFIAGETKARKEAASAKQQQQKSKKDSKRPGSNENLGLDDTQDDDKQDLDWATVLKRTFESYIRGERPNMYGEWLQW